MATTVGLIKDKPIKLIRKLPQNLPTVRADATKIRQVLLNLLSNAAKFTEEGSITVELGQGFGPQGTPEVFVRVTDTGPGIAQKDQAKLFQPFSQVDDSPTRKTGGTGLGLSICKSLIELHGGRIGLFWSDVGQGSAFYFSLPIPPSSSGQAGEGETAGRAAKKRKSTPDIVLAVDDDPQVIGLYQRYLTPAGYSVIPVTDSSLVLEQARQLKPFAITLDIMMPRRDGWQVLHDLKNDPATRSIPVIICSILEEGEKGASLGAADYLVKPILQEDLVNAINRLNHDGAIRDILVVDDDPGDLRLIQKILEQNGDYRITLAQGGVQGWNAIASSPPHAVILDLFMPDMNGFTLLSRLRSDPALRDLPVIVLTGADLTAEQHQQLSDFGQQFLAKDLLTEPDLLNYVAAALKRFKLPA